MPFGASDILENCSLSLLKDIFDDHPSDQDNQNYTLENSTHLNTFEELVPSNSQPPQPLSDAHIEVDRPDLQSNPILTQETNKDNSPVASSNNMVTNNQLSDSINESSIENVVNQLIENGDELDNNDMCAVNTPMSLPGLSTFGEEEPIPSVPSLLSDASSTVSQYPSSSDVPTPLSSRKRKFTKKRDSGRLREKFCHEWIDSKRKRLKNTGKTYNFKLTVDRQS